MTRAERIAAIDIGSNTILFLIADHVPATGLVTVEDGEDQPRLGAGLSTTGRLSQAAMQRALQSLTRMRDICRHRGATRVAAVATAAVREAENGENFVEEVRALGIPTRIISPETEAALAYRSAAYHFPTDGRLLLADIGGGSLELVGAEANRIELTESLPLGVVRLTELRLSTAALRDQIRRLLGRAVSRRDWSGARVIGSGGTFITLASIMLAGRGLPSSPIHGTAVSLEELERLVGELDGMTLEQRRHVPGLNPARADIIVAGLAVAAELLSGIAADSVTVSGYGLREGVLLEMIGHASGSAGA